jgi:hypothetical protein
MRGYGSQPGVFAISVLLFFITVHSASVPAPRCNARANSTVKITVVEDQRVRRADDSPGEHTSNIAPRCNARSSSTVNATANDRVIHVDHIRRADKFLGTNKTITAPRCNARLNSTIRITELQVDRFRRADHSSGGLSPEYGSSEDEGSNASSEKIPINYADYVSHGRLANVYMRASDADVTANLVAKGKLRQGEQLASTFTEVGAFASNGWSSQNATPTLAKVFKHDVPFHLALQALGLSEQARPQGKNELISYHHELPWTLDGRPMQVSPCPDSLCLRLAYN